MAGLQRGQITIWLILFNSRGFMRFGCRVTCQIGRWTKLLVLRCGKGVVSFSSTKQPQVFLHLYSEIHAMIPAELMQSILQKARSLKKTIVLPDATDERAIQAARILQDKGIVTPILVGD